MPQNKLTEQWSEDDHKQADSYTADMTQKYADQGKPGSSSNRAHADFSYRPDIGGTSQIRPVQPDCDGMQFARNPYEPDNYLSVKRDRWNNEIAEDRTMHTPMPAGDSGQSGTRQFSDFQKVDGYSSYGVEIPHGQSAAFNNSSTVYVDNSRADRGSDS